MDVGIFRVGVLIFLPALLSDDSVRVARCDWIEVNQSVVPETGASFRQLIFWSWHRVHKCYHVRDWRILRDPSEEPVREYKPDRVSVTWVDAGVTYKVIASWSLETKTFYDPERIDRQSLDEVFRRPLFDP